MIKATQKTDYANGLKNALLIETFFFSHKTVVFQHFYWFQIIKKTIYIKKIMSSKCLTLHKLKTGGKKYGRHDEGCGHEWDRENGL